MIKDLINVKQIILVVKKSPVAHGVLELTVAGSVVVVLVYEPCCLQSKEDLLFKTEFI